MYQVDDSKEYLCKHKTLQLITFSFHISGNKRKKGPKKIELKVDALPSSLWTHLRVQVCGNAEGVGTWSRSLAHNTWRGRGACWSSEMGLGRIDKLIHSHGPAHNPHKVVSA
jgi:hypothetical protein